ncbi:MAG: methylenetetrahydrofolate--tRNA-(uracil(54)-C(5))-methyltransferase (FADH(2)-oxidizing) TrmFO [Fibromonadaceae bacterium]|jgi:methylenetetrahydrofolate--tRNA-(uracil-5-)-methyltransferase|nr:methylenetetrahydrofolate--tRNA-(uracil(54)-C(5))-methyltransferase (FADH(2)-oxidizing) TrmFO [Fibromonadaceae bacterium]
MRVRVIGGGLAGCEAALQLACRGFEVDLYEMRKGMGETPAHKTSDLAELVCSNSFKGTALTSAHGLLKNELKMLGSFLLQAAEKTKVPAGESLTVDRELFSKEVEELVAKSKKITLHPKECVDLISEIPTLVAAGPLCSDALATQIKELTGGKFLRFFDAIAPVIDSDSIDYSQAFAMNRHEKGETADFINCPLDKETYLEFVKRLQEADSVEEKPFEKKELFEGCLPIEEMARRGTDTLRFGPMRPIGLGKHYAVIQLRAENRQKTLYNMVGFQTRLKWNTQKEIFRLVPALKNAEFARLGCMHRNTFIESPKLLDPSLKLSNPQSLIPNPQIWFAGQITGAEGYTEAIATGWYAAWNMANSLLGKEELLLPHGTCVRALVEAITAPNEDFQPMNFNFGLLPRPERLRKSEKKDFFRELSRKNLIIFTRCCRKN